MRDRLVSFASRHYYLLSAVLIYLSFPSYDVWFLKGFPFFAWFALVPLYLAVRDRSLREAYVILFVTFFIGNLLAYQWIGMFGKKVPGGDIIILVPLILLLALFSSLKIILGEMLSRRYEKFRFLIMPAVWIVVEWVQSLGYFAYPLPWWGYTQYTFLPLVQMSAVTGIMGVTFLVVCFNNALAEAIGAARGGGWVKSLRLHPVRRFAVTATLAALIIAAGGAAMMSDPPTGKRDLRVALVQSCISPWENWSANKFIYLSELTRYTADAVQRDPDFIIWSESATLETISFNYRRGAMSAFEAEMYRSVRDWGKPLLTGEIGVAEQWQGKMIYRYPQNNAVLIDPEGRVVNSYAKIHLVPLGEWFPYERALPFVKNIASSMGGSSFIPGERPVLFEVAGRKFGTLICYEGIFHRLCREYRRMGAQYFVNITNDGWTDTFRGHMQHFSVSTFRAVENGIWYVRAGNTGYSAVIDPRGRILADMPILTKGSFTGDIDFSRNRDTLYTIAGDWVLYLALAFLLALSGREAVTVARKRWNRRNSIS